ncbi:hypothetical protein HK101_011613 [Irineochytrium annulatum]|nr:hypothetical protein HK101_011613 [Irineochytrium annulatum]
METEDEPEARIVITGSDSGDPVAMEDVAPTVPSPAAATPSAPAVLSAIPSHLRVNTSGFGGDGGSGPSTPGGGAQATPPNSAAVAVNPNPLPLSAMDLTRTLEDVAMRDAT